MSAVAEVAPSLVADGFALVREAAAFLRVSRSNLYLMMDSGDLPYARFGKSRRVPWRALREYAERCVVSR
jgi:excisionase family DNA binding protein